MAKITCWWLLEKQQMMLSRTNLRINRDFRYYLQTIDWWPSKGSHNVDNKNVKFETAKSTKGCNKTSLVGFVLSYDLATWIKAICLLILTAKQRTSLCRMSRNCLPINVKKLFDFPSLFIITVNQPAIQWLNRRPPLNSITYPSSSPTAQTMSFISLWFI